MEKDAKITCSSDCSSFDDLDLVFNYVFIFII